MDYKVYDIVTNYLNDSEISAIFNKKLLNIILFMEKNKIKEEEK